MTTFAKTLAIATFIVMATSLIGAENLLKNGNFSEGMENWSEWQMPPVKKAGFTSEVKDKKYTVSMPEVAKAKNWYAQLKQRISLEAGKKYKVGIKLITDKPGTIGIYYQLDGKPYKTLGLAHKFKIKPGENAIYRDFKAVGSDSEVKPALKIYLGNTPGNIKISEVTLTEVQ